MCQEIKMLGWMQKQKLVFHGLLSCSKREGTDDFSAFPFYLWVMESFCFMLSKRE